MINNANKSAFPIVLVGERFHHVEDGLSKHEYFAAQAMQGLLSFNEWHTQDQYKLLAICAVKIADEMVKALEESNDD